MVTFFSMGDGTRVAVKRPIDYVPKKPLGLEGPSWSKMLNFFWMEYDLCVDNE
jgi:hypothetical protein